MHDTLTAIEAYSRRALTHLPAPVPTVPDVCRSRLAAVALHDVRALPDVFSIEVCVRLARPAFRSGSSVTEAFDAKLLTGAFDATLEIRSRADLLVRGQFMVPVTGSRGFGYGPLWCQEWRQDFAEGGDARVALGPQVPSAPLEISVTWDALELSCRMMVDGAAVVRVGNASLAY